MLVTDCHCCVIEETWHDIAVMAWAGYLNDGRGLVRIDTTHPHAPGVRPAMLYQPLAATTEVDELKLVTSYDPNHEAVVCVVDASGRHVCRAGHLDLTPPTVYAHAATLPPSLVA